MNANLRRRASDKIIFSIGAKLITIISIIVVLSLGSITLLVSWLVQADLQISAEENNFEANRRSAMEADTLLANVRSASRVLMRNVTAVGPDSRIASDTTDFFFEENPDIASVFFIVHGNSEQLLVNRRFFYSREIDEALADSYFQDMRSALARAIRGETLLLNATPHFSRPVLALFFPYTTGSPSQSGVGAVVFSSESLNDNFGFGINQSYMINYEGDILSHSDFNLVRSALNVSNEGFIRFILDSPDKNRQQLIEDEFNFMRASPAQSGQNFFSITAENISRNILPELAKAVNFVSDNFFKFLRSINIDQMFRVRLVAPQWDVNREKRGQTVQNTGNTMRQFVAFTKLSMPVAVVITSIEYDKVFEGIAATTRRNIYLTVAVLSISIIFVWFFSKTISIPLKALAGAARSIEGGVFDLNLKQRKAHDEIGLLTGSFQKMCSALNIFGRFTNKEIAVKAMRGEIKPGGLPKHATVFFSDIRSFTALSENFTVTYGSEASDRIVHWLNEYLTQMVSCIEKTNGVVDKFIGDAVMAHWGTAYTTGSPRTDAFNCIKATLMMRKALYELNKSRNPNDVCNPVIRIGCGINTGIVTAGQIGSDLRMEYTVIGDPVNLASRVEALTKPLGADILITEDTWNLVGDKFITEEMPSVTVKGKEKPVRIFAVVNLANSIKMPQTLDEVRNMLGIKPPDLSKVDLDAEEKKYKIGEQK